MTDYKQLYEYQLAYSQAFETFYHNRTKRHSMFIMLGGIIAKMGSDVIEYEKRNGKTSKLDDAKDRCDKLQMIYTELTGLDEENCRLRLLLRDISDKNAELENENESLKAELEAAKKAWEEMD